MKFIRKIPIPLCGVALGCAALGNLLQSYSEGVRSLCGLVAGVLVLLFLVKLIRFPKAVADDMGNPVMASVSGTLPMSLMLLAGYLKPVAGRGAYVLWLLAIALHAALIVYFTVKFVAGFKLNTVHASWYIVYVGIAVAAVTAPAFQSLGVGAATFWFSLAALVVLLAAVTARYAKLPVPDPAKPLMCIYAAPASLCIAGYVQSVTPKSAAFLLALYAVACALYLFALLKLLGFLRLPFYPSYAAFTFPFVISAIASKQTMACLAKMQRPMPALGSVVAFQTAVAVVLVIYTLIRFVMFLSSPPKSA